MGAVGLFLATAVQWDVFRPLWELPGLSFFQGSGRYGVLLQLAVTVACARGFDRLRTVERLREIRRPLIAFAVPVAIGALASVMILLSEKPDGWMLSLQDYMTRGYDRTPPQPLSFIVEGLQWWLLPTLAVTAAALAVRRWQLWLMVVVVASFWIEGNWNTGWPYPAGANFLSAVPSRGVHLRKQSPVGDRLRAMPFARVVAPGPNLVSILGVSTLPPYLGLGPAEYFNDDWVFRDVDFRQDPTPQQANRLIDNGVTHLLLMEPASARWPVELVWTGFDAFLHRSWARDRHDPLYLYAVQSSAPQTGPVRLISGDASKFTIASLGWTEYRLTNQSKQDATIELRVLNDNGWHVELADTHQTVPTQPSTDSPFFTLTVPPSATCHVSYRPRVVWIGAGLSLAATIGVIVLFFFAGRRRKQTSAAGSDVDANNESVLSTPRA